MNMTLKIASEYMLVFPGITNAIYCGHSRIGGGGGGGGTGRFGVPPPIFLYPCQNMLPVFGALLAK